MCGIFGYVSNDVNKVDANAFKILGIMNESRGGQSCGIMIDSDILHGVSISDKLFRDFSKNRTIKPQERPLLFGHTRKASSGIINEHNAHPFGFGTNKIDKGYAFIGAHNGTLYNHEDLAKTYGVEISEEVNDDTTNVTTYRRKIDSEVLLESLYKSKNFKPLSDYDGGAALVWYTPDNNTVYLFSGESKPYTYSQESEIERPLHVWVIDDNTFAFSSEGTPLEVLGAKTEEVFQIKTNTVYEIKDGNFKGAKMYSVSRANNTNKRPVYSTPHRSNAGIATTNYYGSAYGSSSNVRTTTKNNSQENNKNGEKVSYKSATGEIITVSKPILPEKIVENKGFVYDKQVSTFNVIVSLNNLRGRVYNDDFIYKKNGHAIETGVYTNMPGFGFFKIADSTSAFNEWIETNKGKFFDITCGLIVIGEENSHLLSPRYVKISKEIIKPYYIFRGYLLKHEYDYHYAVASGSKLYDEVLKKMDYGRLSHLTIFPVKNLTYDNADRTTYCKYIKDGAIVKEGLYVGICFNASIQVVEGSIVKQTEVPKYHLLGIDLANKLEYNQALSKYEEAKKIAEKQESEKKSVLSEKTLHQITKDLKDYGVNLEPICPSDTDEDVVELLVSDLISLYARTVEDAFVERTDYNKDKLKREIVNTIDVYTDLTYEDLFDDIIKELRAIDNNTSTPVEYKYNARGLKLFLTTNN